MTESQKTQVTNIVNGILNDHITDLIEEVSSNDFIERVMDELEQQGTTIDLDNEDSFENIKLTVGDTVVPLLVEMTYLLLGTQEQE